MFIEFLLFLKVMFEQLDGITISNVIACIGLALTATIVYAVICNKRNQQRSIGFLTFVFWAVLYFEITFVITILRREPGTEYHSGEIVPYIFVGRLNGDVYDKRQVIYNFLNVVLFVPIGFFLSGLRKESSELKDTFISFLFGFLISFCIETIQLITKRGNFELNDIVTNTFGSFLGVMIFVSIRRIREHERIKK